jgi:hypothetical protein
MPPSYDAAVHRRRSLELSTNENHRARARALLIAAMNSLSRRRRRGLPIWRLSTISCGEAPRPQRRCLDRWRTWQPVGEDDASIGMRTRGAWTNLPRDGGPILRTRRPRRRSAFVCRWALEAHEGPNGVLVHGKPRVGDHSSCSSPDAPCPRISSVISPVEGSGGDKPGRCHLHGQSARWSARPRHHRPRCCSRSSGWREATSSFLMPGEPSRAPNDTEGVAPPFTI